MSRYIVEAFGKSGQIEERDAFVAINLDEIKSRTIIALSQMAYSAFAEGSNSVSAAVRDQNGKRVFAAKMSITSTWL